MEPDVVITWEQSQMSGVVRSTWHARVTAPVTSVPFAYVARTIHGQWYAVVKPKGHMGKPWIDVDYASPEKAKSQVERWARHHWQTIPIDERLSKLQTGQLG